MLESLTKLNSTAHTWEIKCVNNWYFHKVCASGKKYTLDLSPIVNSLADCRLNIESEHEKKKNNIADKITMKTFTFTSPASCRLCIWTIIHFVIILYRGNALEQLKMRNEQSNCLMLSPLITVFFIEKNLLLKIVSKVKKISLALKVITASREFWSY